MPLDQLFSGLSDGNLDPRSVLTGLLGSPGTQGALGGAASGALVSLLLNEKARKKLSKSAPKVGGAAALAGLGYYAYQQWQRSRASAPAAAPAPALPTSPPPLPPDFGAAAAEVRVSSDLPLKLVLAMIAAAAADGKIDDAEMDALMNAIDQAPLEPDEKSRLTAALNDPPTVEGLASLASDEEEASELYAAALATIEVDTPAEDFFLRRLAKALALDPGLVESLHRSLEQE
jgi:uncharacterized membrane protein YebE (DUF533 family)